MYPNVIWIISSKSVLIFFKIGYWEVTYLCRFAFNFLGSMSVLLLNVLWLLL
jgi:hypothetical protein